jgi:hypothetical protein
MRISNLRNLLLALPVTHALAQAPDLQLNVVYMCTGGLPNFKVFSCDKATGACQFQNYKNGQANQRGEALRVQLIAALPKCHVQTPEEAQSNPQRGDIAAPAPVVARGRGNSQPGAPAAKEGGAQVGAAQVGGGGFKVGETVRTMAYGAWQEVVILQVKGNSYFVRFANNVELWRSWPDEIRRLGKLTAEDHALGQYDLREFVQVLVNGRWMEGKIIGQNLTQYTVQLPGENPADLYDDRRVMTSAQNLRPSAGPPPAAQRPAGQAPKAGLASCAGKFEGRWEHTMGGLRIVFRAGKATVTEALTGDMQFECWTGGGKIYLYKAGSFTSAPEYDMEINNDGTIQTLIGELKKKGN